jgi:glucokinase
MEHGIGVVISDRIVLGAVADRSISGSLRFSPENYSESESLLGTPADAIIDKIIQEIKQLHIGRAPSYFGLGMPGIVRNGIVEDSPNLVQFKGVNVQELVVNSLRSLFGDIPVAVFNDADVMAAGIAATRGLLGQLIRVWTLGTGIGYGRYPYTDGVWEAGHSVVTLDPKEKFCGCGGKGHLEGIMGHRAMRLRFMDMEPEEIFQQAEAGEARCVEFVKRWHRALAAATATSIHLDGPGKFFVTGLNARFVKLAMLNDYLNEMVKLSPLQSYSVEVVPGGENVAVIGAAVNAAHAVGLHP